jgi:hypothetical protein
VNAPGNENSTIFFCENISSEVRSFHSKGLSPARALLRTRVLNVTAGISLFISFLQYLHVMVHLIQSRLISISCTFHFLDGANPFCRSIHLFYVTLLVAWDGYCIEYLLGYIFILLST